MASAQLEWSPSIGPESDPLADRRPTSGRPSFGPAAGKSAAPALSPLKAASAAGSATRVGEASQPGIGPRRRPGWPDPRLLLLAGALAFQALALVAWPVLGLLESADASGGFGAILRHRFERIDALFWALKGGVDTLLPGALWTWEALVSALVWGLALAFAVYALLAWRLARAGGATPGLRWVLLPLVPLQLTLWLAPASLTTDIFNYAIYGEMPVRFGANPFISAPADFPDSALYYLIPLYWHDAPSVYGPLWVALSTAVAAIFQSRPLAEELLAYRAIANLAHLANVGLVWGLARRISAPTAPAAAFAYGWNPLCLLEFAANGHNDVLMLTLVLAALALGVQGKRRMAAMALGGSIALKYTTVLLAPAVLVWLAVEASRGRGGAATPWRALTSRAGLREFATGGALASGAVAALYLPWFVGIETFGPVLYWVTGPRFHHYWPQPLLYSLTAWSQPLLGSPAWNTVYEPLLASFRILTRLALALVIAGHALQVRRLEDVLRGGAGVWLVFLLLVNTWIMPWYYAWSLTLAAALGWRSGLLRACAGLTLTAPAVLYGQQLGFAPVGDWGGLMLTLPLALLAAERLLARVRGRRGPTREVALGSGPAEPATPNASTQSPERGGGGSLLPT